MTKLNDNGEIYNQHDKAFQDVAAWVICKDGERVATVARKTTGRRSPNGLTVTVYLHVIGLPMTKGIARGYGYSMTDAAFANAAKKIPAEKPSHIPGIGSVCVAGSEAQVSVDCQAYPDAGHSWDHHMSACGYSVFQAV